MAGIFGQVLSAFKGILSNAFWFGAFLPVAVFAAVNLLLATQVSSGANDLLTKIGEDKWDWLVPAVLGLIVAAYVLGPMVRLFRAMFDGRRLPEWLFTLLLPLHVEKRDRADSALQAEYSWQGRVNRWRQRAQTTLDDARGAQRQALDEAAANRRVADAYRRVNRLTRRVSAGRGKSISEGEVLGVQDALVAARRSIPPRAEPIVDALQQSFLQALSYLTVMAGSYAARRLDRKRRLPPQVQATSIGNVRQYLENYANDVYQADFDFLWPRVQAVIGETDVMAKHIEAARSLADFAVLSFLLTIVTVFVWLPVLALHDTTPWRFLAVGVLGPVVGWVFFHLIVESQISLGELAQIAIDRFRFEVLKTLHIKPPPTLSAERQIWKTLSDAARGEGVAADIAWTLPPQ